MKKFLHPNIKQALVVKNKAGMQYVEWEELKLKMGKKEFGVFFNWMIGQTCFEEGPYLHDLKHFLNHGEDAVPFD